MAKHRVVLTVADRERLRALLRRSSTSALQQRRARILLAVDSGSGRHAPTDGVVAAATEVAPWTVARVRVEVARYGLERALGGGRRSSRRDAS